MQRRDRFSDDWQEQAPTPATHTARAAQRAVRNTAPAQRAGKAVRSAQPGSAQQARAVHWQRTGSVGPGAFSNLKFRATGRLPAGLAHQAELLHALVVDRRAAPPE
eukprot:738319-Rhodomonas_salina.3